MPVYLAQRRSEPTPEGWRALGEPGARALEQVWKDRQADTYVRQRALGCLAHFDQPWVGDVLAEVLAERDHPDVVRAEAATSLLARAERLGEVDPAIARVLAQLDDLRNPTSLRQLLPAVLARHPSDAVRARLEALASDTDPALSVAARGGLAGVAQELERRRHAALVRVKMSASGGEFVPAAPDARRAEVAGPDYLGEWKPVRVVVSLEAAGDPVTARIDFDARDANLEFLDTSPDGAPRFESVSLKAGEKITLVRRIRAAGGVIASALCVAIDGATTCAHDLPYRVVCDAAR